MKNVVIFVFILTTFYLILTTSIFADSKILINEFLIDPQPQSVEIFNSGTQSADISDWVIDDSGGTTFYTIPKESVIFPNQCLVFSADFNLNKMSEDTIRLINASQQLIDSFSYKSSSGSGISYFRSEDGTDIWTSGSANLGKYNGTEQACLFPTLTMTPSPIQPTPTDVQTPNLGVSTNPTETGNPSPTCTDQACLVPTVQQSLDNIYLSEVMVNPTTGEKEWIEIYNNNDFAVNLNSWYIDDLENAGSTPKIFSLEISAKSYGVFDLSSSMFNNDEDSVRLLDFNKNLKDDFEYSKSEHEKTLGRTSFESDDFCLQEPSKNSVNNSCINPTPTLITPTTSKFQGLTLPAGRQVNQTPTKNILQTKIPIITGRETRPLQYLLPQPPPDVLGVSDELIIEPSNNKSLINLLCFLSTSYSLLTIISILFRMKLLYGKDKNFYSPSLRSS